MRGLLAILAVLAAPVAQAAETVTWIIYDTPPQYIYEGALAGHGYKDRQLAYLTAHLPQFRHRIIKGSVSRLWYEIGHQDGVCTLGMLPNKEREDSAVLADRPVLVPGFHLAIAADRAYKVTPFLDAQGEVDLDQLAGSHRVNGGYLTGRVHAKAIEDFIGRPDLGTPLAQVHDLRQLYTLVQSGRLDFTFGGPHEIRYFEKILGGKAITALPIKGVPRLVKTYLSCSKRPLGEAVMAAADKLLADEKNWADFLSPLKDWMSGEDMAAALAVKPVR